MCVCVCVCVCVHGSKASHFFTLNPNMGVCESTENKPTKADISVLIQEWETDFQKLHLFLSKFFLKKKAVIQKI